VALSLVFTARDWPFYLPVGLLWGAIVLNFDRWIVSSLDYGPLTADDPVPSERQQARSKAVHFTVRFIMAALVGLVISEPIVLAIFGPEISQQLAAQHVSDVSQQTAQINAAAAKQLAIINRPVAADQQALRAAARKAGRAHRIYLCELTAQCHNLPPGLVTQVPGLGPQTTQDYQLWRADVRLQNKAQQTASNAAAQARKQAAALTKQTADQEDRRRQRPAGARAGTGHAEQAELGVPDAAVAAVVGTDVHRPRPGPAQDVLTKDRVRRAAAQRGGPPGPQLARRRGGRQRSRKQQAGHHP
jgi:hypothetical protein